MSYAIASMSPALCACDCMMLLASLVYDRPVFMCPTQMVPWRSMVIHVALSDASDSCRVRSCRSDVIAPVLLLYTNSPLWSVAIQMLPRPSSIMSRMALFCDAPDVCGRLTISHTLRPPTIYRQMLSSRVLYIHSVPSVSTITLNPPVDCSICSGSVSRCTSPVFVFRCHTVCSVLKYNPSDISATVPAVLPGNCNGRSHVFSSLV